MKPGRIRPIAICVIRHHGRILVFEGYDHVKQRFFYRPLGGTIEFGERGHQAVVRELREEIGAEVVDVRYLATVETIFTCNGEQGHEIVMVYEGRFAHPALYECESIPGCDDGNPDLHTLWKSLDDLALDELKPDGLLDLLINEP